MRKGGIPGKIVLVVLATLVALGVLGLARYLKSPQFSLARTLLAANSGDWDGVRRYVDTEAISREIADEYVDEQAQKLPSTGPIYDWLGERMQEVAKPVVAESIESAARIRVEERATRKPRLRDMWGAFASTKQPRRVLIADDRALVTLDVMYNGRSYPLELRMQRDGRAWRVIKVENLGDLIGEPGDAG